MAVSRQAEPAPRSLLGVDVGSAFTKAALFELVDGRHRLIARGQARTTADKHVFDGLEQACREIEELTGRQLFSAGEPLAGDVSGGRGVDALAVSVSCQPPLRVLATGLASAEAARSERAQVTTLAEGSLRDRVAQLAGRDFDAIAGPRDDVELAAQCLGRDFQADRPALVCGSPDEIRAELGKLALRTAVEDVAGLAELEAEATEPLVTGSAALLELARIVAERYGLRLAIADAGASHVTIACASSADAWVRTIERDGTRLDMPTSTARMRAMHEDLERALGEVAPAGLMADLLLGTGALARFRRWAEPVLTVLNGIQPAGVIQLALDSANIVSQIATLARGYPDIACQLFESDGLVGLGAAVCPSGDARKGANVVEVRWHSDDEPEESVSVNSGELTRVPLRPGQKASLALYPAKGIDVGLNRAGVAASAHVDGGRVGLVVDGRLAAGEKRGDRERWEAALE